MKKLTITLLALSFFAISSVVAQTSNEQSNATINKANKAKAVYIPVKTKPEIAAQRELKSEKTRALEQPVMEEKVKMIRLAEPSSVKTEKQLKMKKCQSVVKKEQKLQSIEQLQKPKNKK